MNKLVVFIKNEIVMLLSFVLAVASAFFVTPSKEYINYIDYRTLILLFSLMTIMAGLNKLGVFKILAEKLLGKVKTLFGLVLTFVLLCFFSSMIITNDVSLITFVPFTIVTFKMAGESKKLIYTVTLETVAANLGSMLTPIGNPQNLYLFSAYNMNILDFFKTIATYALLSLVLLIIATFLVGTKKVSVSDTYITEKINVRILCFYILLFVLALLSVFRVVHFIILLAVIIVAVFIIDKKSLAKVDYSLLLTFVFLFIFIGNLGNIPGISDFLHNVVEGNEVITGVITSQVFSNVPAAILLSGFTNNAQMLLIGVNLGGLGTIIASMASLISFKFIQKENVKSSKYLLVFSVINIVFLILNLCLWLIIK
ncbi:MAG: anion permease [Ruminococcus sp.]|nr:anion permease [Ruminococcus sp.]